MPKASVAVTVSVPRKYLLFITLITAALLALGAAVALKSSSPKLRISNATFTVEIKDTNQERQQGLSGRDSLPKNKTMLFVFQESAKRCFWMKDMKFPIDIVWIDASKKITAIERSVKPESYPTDYCYEAQYVAEFAAGVTKDHDISVGTQVDF